MPEPGQIWKMGKSLALWTVPYSQNQNVFKPNVDDFLLVVRLADNGKMVLCFHLRTQNTFMLPRNVFELRTYCELME